jgi:hypothetical protein
MDMQSKSNDQIRAERLIERSLGAGWNKPLKRYSGTAGMDDLLKYLAKIFKTVKDEDNSLTPDQMTQVILVTGEIMGRDPPKDIQDAVASMDYLEVEHIAKEVGYNPNGEDRCEMCGTTFDSEDYHTHMEREEYWGAPAYRKVVDKVTCHNCGFSG